MKKIIIFICLLCGVLNAQTRRPSTGNGVPYTGATSNVDLNEKALKNVSSLSVGTADVYTVPLVVTDTLDSYFFDSDPEIVSARTFDPAINTNGHGFVYSSNFERNFNGLSHNSFKDHSAFTGTVNYGHHSFLESNFDMAGSGNLSEYFGFVDIFSKSSGSTTNRYMNYMYDASGAGTLSNQYALYVPTLSAATGKNVAIYVQSNPSYLGGGAQFCSVSGSPGATTPKVQFLHGTPFPGIETAFIQSELTSFNNKLNFTLSGYNFSGTKTLLMLRGDETGTGSDSVYIKASRVKINASNLNFSAIPTSSAGLSAGQVWNNLGVLNIIP